MFHSYVSLPEGILLGLAMIQDNQLKLSTDADATGHPKYLNIRQME